MSELVEIRAEIATTKLDLAQAKRDNDLTRRDRLENLLIEQLKTLNYLLAAPNHEGNVIPLFVPLVPPSKISSLEVKEKQNAVGPFSVCCHEFCLMITKYLLPKIPPVISKEVQSLYTGFNAALEGSDSLGYFNQKNMSEPGITAFLVAEAANCLNSFSTTSKWSDSFMCLHQAELNEIKGNADCGIFARFSNGEAEVFHGWKCLYPVAFIDVAKHSTSPANKKLAQASMYANGCLTLQRYEEYNFFVPIFGVVMSELDIICIMYFPIIENKQWRIAEIRLADFKYSVGSLMTVMDALYKWSVEIRNVILKTEELEFIPISLYPVVAQSILIDSEHGVVYKAFDYRKLKSLPFKDRRVADNYKWSKLDFSVEIDYKNDSEAFT